ncbi:hypothetical protein 3S15_30 [uncultured Caudovirales phage]|uniref:Uncharacterized protein n=1 Tax=uncultured Caudovirales phage TaxID=2100421 RepID=A0A2H4JEZ6_9CAUD|nr:hypothetical protein 3S15_30 [uncultured Caudovirales phage]
MTPAEQQIETKIVSLGLTAPRITPQHIHKLLEGVNYHTHVIPGTTTILATAIMPSGFTLATAESACVSPENFNLQLGIEIAIRKAKDAAIDALWKLEGYRLKQTMHEIKQEAGQAALDRMRATVAADKQASTCGHLSGDPSACACPGGLCSDAIDLIGCR